MTEEQKAWVQVYATILASLAQLPDKVTWEAIRNRAKIEADKAMELAKEYK